MPPHPQRKVWKHSYCTITCKWIYEISYIWNAEKDMNLWHTRLKQLWNLSLKKNEAWTRFELTTTGCFDWFSRELKRDICSFLAAWFKCHVIILGDLNCNVLGSDPDGCALSDFCSTFGLSQLFKTPTRVTERSKSLIDVALTTNENIIHACDVKQSAESAITVW